MRLHFFAVLLTLSLARPLALHPMRWTDLFQRLQRAACIAFVLAGSGWAAPWSAAAATGDATGAVVVSVVGAPPPSTSRPIVYCADASPEGFDPALWDSASTHNATRQMFEGLLALDRRSGQLLPALATHWHVTADARTVEFTLRSGVKFHHTGYFRPTRDFNADDVVFTFSRFIHPNLPFNLAFAAPLVPVQNLGLTDLIERVEKIDALHVRFVLRRPNLSFVNDFAMPFAGIQSAEYAQRLLDQGMAWHINSHPIGTGPFQFKSYAKDEVLRLQAHPAYWSGVQTARDVIFSITQEAAVRVQKLLAGECQITAPIRDVDVAAVQGRPDVVLLKTQALNISYLAFNMRKSPTRLRAVREALDIAFDRQAAFKALFPRGDALQAVSAFPPHVPGYDATLRNEFNPQRARALLAQAGFPTGLDVTLWALPVSRPSNPNGLLLAQLLQQDWARIGVRTHIRTYEWGEYLKRANRGEHDIYMSGWSSDVADPDTFLTPNLSCASSQQGVKFCDRAFDKLLDEARSTADPARRQAIYIEAQRIFKQERPWITFAHSMLYIPIRRGLHGFVMAPDGSVDFKGVVRN